MGRGLTLTYEATGSLPYRRERKARTWPYTVVSHKLAGDRLAGNSATFDLHSFAMKAGVCYGLIRTVPKRPVRWMISSKQGIGATGDCFPVNRILGDCREEDEETDMVASCHIRFPLISASSVWIRF
ncbi:hypothetical protein J6590_054043 [Homalodisca vitripennis]|nr:hypothetical protein J6590_054043 [Homalodisca vitripennis]